MKFRKQNVWKDAWKSNPESAVSVTHKLKLEIVDLREDRSSLFNPVNANRPRT